MRGWFVFLTSAAKLHSSTCHKNNDGECAAPLWLAFGPSCSFPSYRSAILDAFALDLDISVVWAGGPVGGHEGSAESTGVAENRTSGGPADACGADGCWLVVVLLFAFYPVRFGMLLRYLAERVLLRLGFGANM